MRVVEQHNILTDQRDVVAQAIEADILQGMTINADFPAIDLVKTRQQVGSRCLAATGGADQRHAFAGAQGQRNRIERRAIGAGVSKGDVVEFDQPLRTAQRFLAVVGFGIFIDQRKNAFRRCQATLDRCIDIGNPAQRSHHHQHGGDEGYKTADRRLVIGRLLERHAHDDGDTQRAKN
jgi:hypothetical protein